MWISLSHLIDLIYSEKCALCGDLLTPERGFTYPLCYACATGVAERTGPFCSVCSSILVSEKETCTRCRERNYRFTSNYSLFAYEGKIRELISQFKTKNAKPLAGFFAARMAPLISAGYPGFAVVPVPFRAARKKSRGWDQIEAICRRLSREYGIGFQRFLKRKGSTAQKTLSYYGRLENLKGNICLRKGIRVPEKVLLIDDVFTTGATADACAASLIHAGAKEVRMLSIAVDQ